MVEPLVSCVCVTYGRPILLGEAVKCFIDQTYSNKELIIVNDQEGVTLKMDSERDDIVIENVPERFGSLGEKRNYAMSLTKGDYVCIWDDDDLYLPWRIEDSVKIMEEKAHVDIVKSKYALMSIDNSNYKVVVNLFHSQSCISRKYVEATKYSLISVGEDMDYERGAIIESVETNPLVFLNYRWGLNIHHLSGIADEKQSWKRSLTFKAYQGMEGEIEVSPEFQKDYWQDISAFWHTKSREYGNVWDKKISEC